MTTQSEQVPSQALTRAECLAAAGALDGAVHLMDDDEDAQRLAVLADQWRAQAETAPVTSEGRTPSRQEKIEQAVSDHLDDRYLDVSGRTTSSEDRPDPTLWWLPPLRVRAAWHEIRCDECRVTWGSWVERLIGLSRGYTPKVKERSAASSLWGDDHA